MKLVDPPSLKAHNSMQLDCQARFLVELETSSELLQFLKDPQWQDIPKLPLGEGTNILLTQDLDQMVFKLHTKGMKILNEDKQQVMLKVEAGYNWHQLVEYCVQRNWGGIENLALIPGTVGAAPIQNIGAYGESLSDSVHSVSIVHAQSATESELSNSECQFGYRDSLFKHQPNLIVTAITLKLTKSPTPVMDYFSIGRRNDSIVQELSQRSDPPYSIQDVFNAVVAIRTRKLPDWHTTPSFGSCFKNPIISQAKYAALQQVIPQLQAYPADQLTYAQANDPRFDQATQVKIPVGRLLDFLGWADKPIGNVSTYNHWASIITHNGRATGKEILDYIHSMQQDVWAKFQITIEPEINIL